MDNVLADLGYKVDSIQEAGTNYISLEAVLGDSPTGAAVMFPLEAAPLLAHAILDEWAYLTSLQEH